MCQHGSGAKGRVATHRHGLASAAVTHDEDASYPGVDDVEQQRQLHLLLPREPHERKAGHCRSPLCSRLLKRRAFDSLHLLRGRICRRCDCARGADRAQMLLPLLLPRRAAP